MRASPAPAETLLTKLRKRATRYRYLATAIAVVTIAALVGGGYVVYSYGEMAENLNRALVNMAASRAESYLTLKQDNLTIDKEAAAKWPKDAAKLADEIKRLTGNVVEAQKAVDEGVQEARRNATANAIERTVTRVGVAIIVFFLVQILVTVFRYCLRLAAFYDGRADALELVQPGTDGNLLVALIPLLSPDALDFGKSPRSPLEHVADLVKAGRSGAG